MIRFEMSESDKYRIKRLDENSDYTRWRVRLVAAISVKGLDEVFEPTVDGDK